MASGFDPASAEDVTKAIRVCHEMGADLIKVPCALTALLRPTDEFLRELQHSPPVLIAGGPKNSDIEIVVRSAKDIGFSGYCVGRNIFDSTDPQRVAGVLRSIFSTPN
jgi:DhnA family fructose-bisphosphate aldolase class Ia